MSGQAGDLAEKGAARPPTGAIRLSLGGEAELRAPDGRLLAVRTRKARALLVLLALSETGLSRPRLIGLLWVDRAEEQARASLRQAIYELRALLGPAAVVTRQDRVALAPGLVEHDLACAEAAAAAGALEELARQLAAMQPPPLEGLDKIADALDDWLRAERPRLLDRLAALGRAAGETALARGEPALARSLAEHALRFVPLDEHTLRLALRADAAAGDPMRLHRRYRGFTVELAEEVQAEPTAETRALYEQLRRDPAGPSAQDEHAPARSDPAVARAAARRRPTWLAAAIALVAVLGAALLLLRARPPAVPVIAVVPFDTLSGDSRYVASGIADEVQNRLAHERGVRVVGRFTASQIGGGSDPLTAARKLGISHLLDGSVQAAGARLRVIVRLIRVSDGALLWSDQFDRRTGDAFAVQSDIAARVAGRFGGRRGQRAAAQPAPLPMVYDRYLAARTLIRDRQADHLAEADRTLRAAIGRQPDYAPARALLAQVLILESQHPTSYGRLDYPRAQVEARREAMLAARLDPELGEAQAALGLLSHSGAASIPFYRRAVALDPQRAEYHRWLGQALLSVGRIDEALAAYRRAVAIDPLWALSYEHLLGALVFAGRRQEVAPVAQHFLRLSTDERGRLQVARMVATTDGRLADALRMSRRMMELAPKDRQSRFRYASDLALLGERKAAARLLDPVDEMGRTVLVGSDAEIAAAVRRHAATYWETVSNLWNIDDRLVAAGRGDLLLAMFDQGLGSVARYRPGELVSAPEAASLAIAFRRAGRAAEARAITARLADQVGRERRAGMAPPLTSFDEAVAATLSGDRTAALGALERAAGDAPWQVLTIPYTPLGQTALFAPLRGEPRFRALEARLLRHVNGERAKLGWPLLGPAA